MIAATVMMAGTVVPARAAAPASRAFEVSARASISVALANVQPSFDPAIVDASSSASSIGTSSISSAIWPSFLVDAFFFLYGFQEVERLGLGIAQAGWPQGPFVANATQSQIALSNLKGIAEFPADAGRSSARAAERAADAEAAATTAMVPGGVVIRHAHSTSQISTDADAARGRAQNTVSEIVAGPLTLRGVRGEAAASVGVAAEATQHLTIGAATVAGTPVVIDAGGARATTTSAQTAVNDALEVAGISVRLLPSTEETGADGARARSGGVLVTVTAQATDPTGTPRNAQIGYIFGATEAAARATTLTPAAREPAAPRPSVFGPIDRGGPPTFVPPTRSDTGPPAPVPGTKIRRTFVVTGGATPTPAASARGAFAAILAFALGLLALRPLVRQAAKP